MSELLIPRFRDRHPDIRFVPKERSAGIPGVNRVLPRRIASDRHIRARLADPPMQITRRESEDILS
jgi:hypothetical protein